MDKQLLLSALLLSSLACVWAGTSQCNSPVAPDSNLPAVRNVNILDTFSSFTQYFIRLDTVFDGLEWMFQEGDCPYSAVACTQAAGQDNWIFTRRMAQDVQQNVNLTSIQVLIDYTTNCTAVSPCDPNALGLYILRTAEPVSNLSAYDVVLMPILNNAPIEIPLTGLTDGMYALGIRDNGTCVTLNRVQVYYSVCEVPYSTIEDTGLVFEGSVTVSCVPNTVSASVPTTCSAGGVLSPLTPCECMAGFSGADGMNCVACTMGSYKSMPGSSDCLTCPMFSEATSTGSSMCSCVAGHSRANPSDVATDCDTCASGYFMSDVAETLGQCLLCPAGSTSPGGSQSSCTCDAGLVTSAQQTTTTIDVCGTCATNYYRPSSGACVMCPANSERMVGSDEASCSCTGGRTTTPRGTTTTSGAACNSCALSYYSSGVVDCLMCPSNSVQSSSNSAECSCLDNRVTADGGTTTTSQGCDGCATTHYLNSGDCSPCPQFSTVSDVSTCQCQNKYAFDDGTLTSTSAVCVVILGFTTNYLAIAEGTTTKNIGVSVRAGGSITMNINFQSTRPSNDYPFDVGSSIMFNNANEAMSPINIVGNQLALDSYPFNYTFTIATTMGSYVAGGIIDGSVQVYSQLVVTIMDDDNVTVGFTQPRVQFNETQGQGMVRVSKIGGTSSPLTLRITTSDDTSAINVSTVIEFPPSADSAVLDVMFDILDDNSGSVATRSTMLTLEFVGPSGFEGNVLFDGPNLSSTITVEINNDDPTPTSTPAASLDESLIIGICVGAALVALLIFMIVIVIVCICRLRSINRQGFYTTHEDQTKEPPTMLRYSASLRSISSQTVVPVENTQGTVAKENEFYV